MTSVSTHPDVASWDNPPHLGARGTVVLLPGRGEDPLLYERFGTRISSDAYRVRVVADPVRHPELALRQVEKIAAAEGEGQEGLARPFVLAGSDAGALFAVGLVASGQLAVDGLLLAGLPAERAGEGESRPWEEELGSRTACPTHQGRLADAERLERGALYAPPPARWFERADLSAVRVPVLGLHGAADPVSPLEEIRTRYAAAPHAELVSLADGRHDSFNDISHRSSAATVVLFLERLRLGPEAPAIAVPEELHS